MYACYSRISKVFFLAKVCLLTVFSFHKFEVVICLSPIFFFYVLLICDILWYCCQFTLILFIFLLTWNLSKPISFQCHLVIISNSFISHFLILVFISCMNSLGLSPFDSLLFLSVHLELVQNSTLISSQSVHRKVGGQVESYK